MEDYMIDVIIGFACGMVIGTFCGFIMACLAVAASREKRKDE